LDALAYFSTSNPITAGGENNLVVSINSIEQTVGQNPAGSFATVAAAILAALPGRAQAIYGNGADGALVYDGTSTVLGVVPSSHTYTLNRDVYGHHPARLSHLCQHVPHHQWYHHLRRGRRWQRFQRHGRSGRHRHRHRYPR
jgi:hypothetical protein